MRIAEREIETGQIPPKQAETARRLLKLAENPATAPDSVVQKGKVVFLAKAKGLKKQQG